MTYRKLTPKRWTLARASQAWLGDDHLLVVNSNHFTERYQRFALTDIQAIVVTDGAGSRAGAITGLIVSLGWMALAFATARLGLASILFFALTGTLGAALAVRALLRPPRCLCTVQTSVSREKLTAVWHRGLVAGFLAAVTPEIEAAQKALAEREPSLPSVPLERQPAIFSGPENSIVNPPPPAIRESRNYVAESLFGLMLGDALLVWLSLGVPGSNLLGLLPSIYFAEALLGCVALLHVKSKPSPVAAGLIAACLIALAADIFTVSGVAGVRAFIASTQGKTGVRPGSLWLSPTTTLMVAAGWRVIGGLAGLTTLLLERRHKQS